MKNEDFGELTLMARIAFAIMCFERYAASAYPDIDFQPVAEMMWHIADGSDWIDEASYKYSNIIPDCLFETESCEGFRYLTENQVHVFRAILNPDDSDMNTIMNDIYEIAVSYIYTTVEPYAPRAFPYLQDIIRILESHHIDLPDLNLLSEYTAKKPHRDGKSSQWMGIPVDGKALSNFL